MVAPRFPGSVPAWLTPFVGREADLAALEAAIDGSRWLVVVGTPGVGKTRLVDEAVASMIERDTAPPGGVWCIDLAGVRSIGDAIATIATALELATGDGPALSSVAAAIAGRGPALIVLHEADALGAALPTLVPPLLTGAPDLRVVVTSRARTASSGEICFDVGPLTSEEAFRLFVDRARAVDRDFTPIGCEQIITNLVEALDRIPLAVELAAARVRVMTPAQMAVRPEVLLGVPEGGRLRAALDAAWDALAEWQRAALAQLAVFRGGFDLDAAAAVVDLHSYTGARVVDVLASLRDASLIVARTDVDGLRFDVPAVVREVVREHATDPAAATRHARHVLGRAQMLVAKLDSRDAQVARRRLAVERRNLLAVVDRGRDGDADASEDALAAAIAVAELQIRSGSYRELSEFLARPLARVDEHRRPGLCAGAWWLRGEAMRQAGEVDVAATCYERVRELGERMRDSAALGRAGYGAAAIAFSRGDLAPAVALYRARVTDAGAPDPVTLTRALSDLGVIETVLGRTAEAALAFDRALREARASGCVTGEGRALVGLGQLEQQIGRLDDARGHFERALAIHDLVGDDRGATVAQLQLGLNDHLRGQLELAAARYRAALASAEHIGHRLLATITVAWLGACAHASGRLDEAGVFLERGRREFEELGHAAYRAQTTARLAALDADLGAHARARTRLAAADELVPTGADREVLDVIELCRAHVKLCAGGEVEAARARAVAARAGAVGARVQALVLARRLDGAAAIVRRIVIGPHARWFAADGGEPVALARRGAPSKILAALTATRIAAPGEVVPTHALFEHGWPGQHAVGDSAAQRVYTAIWTLRKLGLRDVIVRVAAGYFIDPAIEIDQREDRGG